MMKPSRSGQVSADRGILLEARVTRSGVEDSLDNRSIVLRWQLMLNQKHQPKIQSSAKLIEV
jgi:hypothetical protein